MRDEFDQSLEGARSKQRAKRRKTNLILNSLIVIVVVLIIFVAIKIFSGGDKDKTEPKNKEPNNEQVSGTENKSSSNQNNNESENNEDENKVTGTNDQDEPISNEDEEVIVEEGGTNPNVRKTIIHPNWKPVGTEQTGVHETVFETGSLDWKEMEKALAYGAGLDHANMTTWFIANGGPNQAIGTVSAKDDQQAYHVYIEWVDGQGWKPTKVEELIENDKGKR